MRPGIFHNWVFLPLNPPGIPLLLDSAGWDKVPNRKLKEVEVAWVPMVGSGVTGALLDRVEPAMEP